MRCPLCESEISKEIYRTPKINILKCRECKMIFQDTSTLPQELKDYYESRQPEYRTPTKYRLRRQENILRRLQKLIKDSNSVMVDVGSGWGAFLKQSKKYFENVMGLEPNKEQAQFSNREGLDVKNGMYERNSFDSDSVEIITLIQVLEHVENPKDTLENIYFHLKPKGVAVIDVPSFNNPRVLLYRLTGIGKFATKDFIVPHVFYYTPKSLSKICSEVGFKIIYSDIGQYSIKTNNFLLKPIDWLCKAFGVGSITLYLKKYSKY